MIQLALPGMIMVEAQYLAFEVLTLASSQFGSSYLAAQSVVVTLTSITFNIPFPLSIAASTRVANLIGARLSNAARTSGKVVSSTFTPRFPKTMVESDTWLGPHRRLPGWALQPDAAEQLEIQTTLPVYKGRRGGRDCEPRAACLCCASAL